MKEVANQEQAKEIDRYTIEEDGVDGLVLMERAAGRVADYVLTNLNPRDSILAICGTGNNGGDALAAARMCQEAARSVLILLVGKEEKGTPERKCQLELARKAGVPVMEWKEEAPFETRDFGIVMDGMFGIGLTREVTGAYDTLIRQVNGESHQVVAIDIPSGIQAETGKVLGVAIRAQATITFGVNKWGNILYPGASYAGTVKVEDIGFSKEAEKHIGLLGQYLEPGELLGLPPRPAYSNKGTYGKVLILAGNQSMSGAAFLSGAGAYGVGAGLVQIATREENRTILGTLLPEAIHLYYGASTQEALPQIRKAMDWADVIVFGPGVGRDAQGAALGNLVFQEREKPVVIDADGLWHLAEYSGEKMAPNWILTPHLGEFAKLTGKPIEEITGHLLQAAEEYKKEYPEGILVLKDARTLILGEGELWVNLTGNAGMAKGGSGDVLSGILGGLLASGKRSRGKGSMVMPVVLGVKLHGAAGDVAAERKGEYSMMARDLLEALPEVMKDRKE